MKNTLKTLLLLVIAFIIGANWHAMVDYIKKDIRHAVNVQYCHDFYQGRMHACPYYESDILEK